MRTVVNRKDKILVKRYVVISDSIFSPGCHESDCPHSTLTLTGPCRRCIRLRLSSLSSWSSTTERSQTTVTGENNNSEQSNTNTGQMDDDPTQHNSQVQPATRRRKRPTSMVNGTLMSDAALRRQHLRIRKRTTTSRSRKRETSQPMAIANPTDTVTFMVMEDGADSPECTTLQRRQIDAWIPSMETTHIRTAGVT